MAKEQEEEITNFTDFPAAFKPLFKTVRYKIFYGGRGSGKSWCVARYLLVQGITKRVRVLCAREFQTSIKESVHKLLSDQIGLLKLENDYEVQNTRIIGRNGTEFIFKGIRTNVQEIKSLENVDYCWIEEGQAVSDISLDIIIPTIRKENSEIIITFNPQDADDPVFKRFIVAPPPEAVVVKVNWRDNPWFPKTLRKELDYCRGNDPDGYGWIWEGECRKISEAQVFKGRFEVKEFETPTSARFYHGADWGFSQDPTTLVRCFIREGSLYVDMEAWGIGIELDELPSLFNSIPTAKRWPIKADNARPETISHLRRRGFDIRPAKKWAGSIEDGLSALKSFNKVIIHSRCKHTAQEFKMYSYKTDKTSGDVLPLILDANNHCIDALRYALDGYIRGRG